jgi:gluconokinase
MTTIVVMGVAGCGKSTFGRALAMALALPWIEGDDFHSAASKAKMEAGTPLDDADRASWLQTLVDQMARHPSGCVIGCSALKKSYRDTLRQVSRNNEGVKFAYLHLTREEAQRRVSNRVGHFFSDALVASQFEALQVPSDEPDVTALDATSETPALLKYFLNRA